MSQTRLFLGEKSGNDVLLADDGYQDGIAAVPIRVETDPVAPAGVGGEAIFTALYLVFTATMAVTVQVTPIVSGTDESGAPFTLQLTTQNIVLSTHTARTTSHHELGLSLPLLEGATEVARFAPRGTWFSVRIAVTAIATGDLILDGVALEYEVVRESIAAPTVTP